jgi:hypothetical protein
MLRNKQKKLYSSDCQLQLIVIVTSTFPVNFSFFCLFFWVEYTDPIADRCHKEKEQNSILLNKLMIH